MKYIDEELCAQCGTPAAPGGKFCASCGAPLAAASQPAQGLAFAEPAAAYAAPRVQAPYSAPAFQVLYQGVGSRFVAFLIDAIILGIISGILALLLTSSGVQLFTYDASTGVLSIGPLYYIIAVLEIVIELLYFTFLLGRYGQSLGMIVVKIKVISEADGRPITYGAAFIRTILLYIDEIPYVIPYLLGAILIWTSDKKQRLGDRVAHTVVVKA